MNSNKKEGILAGLFYGLIPHIGCIAFILFSVLGVTAAAAFFKPLLLNPYFFHILVALSIVFATISAFFYFKKQGFITLQRGKGGLEFSFLPSGFKRKWKYLLTLYGSTVAINLLLFMVIFPIAANLNSGSSFTASLAGAFGGGEELQLGESSSLITLRVKIPCPGHAPLIIGELKGISGVEGVKFKFPNLFDIGYNPKETSKEEILSLSVFKIYQAFVIEEAEAKATESLSRNVGSCCSGVGCGCGCSR